MKSVNKVILIGRLGSDPEVRLTSSAKKVASVSLATTQRWKGSDGEVKEKTEWHNLVAWDKTAEAVERYTAKGDPVYIEGSLSTDTWEDNSGNKKSRTKVIIRELVFLKGRGTDEQGQTNQPQQRGTPPPPSRGDIHEEEDGLPF
jgi:single-strand DNA-binding protein